MVFKSVIICVGVFEGQSIVKEKGWRCCSFASSMGRMRTRMASDGLDEYRCISSLHPDCIIFI